MAQHLKCLSADHSSHIRIPSPYLNVILLGLPSCLVALRVKSVYSLLVFPPFGLHARPISLP